MESVNLRGRAKGGAKKLGTFGGVFTPSVLTILGIILFRRTGYVVGSAGLLDALLIILLANVITILTSISLGAIATNLKVKGGGDYYLISRTLGVEFGGAIGLVLFLAQSVSIAFYCIGFGEAVASVLPAEKALNPQWIACGAIVFLFFFAWLGADWATRLQYGVMIILGLALGSFFIGGIQQFDPGLVAENWTGSGETGNFWILFAIFFPAVTGFTQGVSMSGDLKDPGKSLPLGTFLAVGLSFVVYVCAAVLLAGAQTNANLRMDYNAMHQVSLAGWVISAGVIAATLSSGMASYLGAPRIMQAMAADRILPVLRVFAKGYGPSSNPRRGVLLSTGIALFTVALGNLNAVATVVSMFFLISYGLLNYATYYEARAASPSFRPRFRCFNKYVSLAGALGCLGAMIAISPPPALISCSVIFSIYYYLKATAGPARWAHGKYSSYFQRIREMLFEMGKEPSHPRDWRPNILAFSEEDQNREQLLKFASWIEGGSGLTTAVVVLESGNPPGTQERKQAREKLQKTIEELGYQAFPLAVSARDFRQGLEMLLQAHGLGPLKPNMILLNWLEQAPHQRKNEKERRYGRNLREAIRMGSNIVVLDAKPEAWKQLEEVPVPDRRIDLWWRGGATSRLMLLLAYLMTRTEDWDGARYRVICEKNSSGAESTRKMLEDMLEEVRIPAEPVVVDSVSLETLTRHSGDASIVFLPMLLHGDEPTDTLGHPLEDVLDRLTVTALAIASEDIQLDADPEEGEVGERAAAEDAVEEAEEEANRVETEAEKARKRADKAAEKVEKLKKEGKAGNEEDYREAVEAAKTAQEEAESLEARSRQAREEADRAAGERDPEEEQD